jgi:chemotaxis family two-component system response regulator Rcp1
MQQPRVLLLVDDTPDDITLFRRALQTVAPGIKLVTMESATAASVYLKQDWPHENAERPDLIVSDSVIDHESGIDLLQWVKMHPRFKDIPFVLLTGDTNPVVMFRARSLGASKVVQKPTNFTDLIEDVRDIVETV